VIQPIDIKWLKGRWSLIVLSLDHITRSTGTFLGTGMYSGNICFINFFIYIYYYAYIFHILLNICEFKRNYIYCRIFFIEIFWVRLGYGGSTTPGVRVPKKYLIRYGSIFRVSVFLRFRDGAKAKLGWATAHPSFSKKKIYSYMFFPFLI
jgi:hypothetical protein